MATVSSLGSTIDTNAGTHDVTAVPAVGDLIVIVVMNTGRTIAQAPTVTDNNSGVQTAVYELCNLSSTKATNVDSMWVYVRTRLITAGNSTIFRSVASADSGGGLEVFKVTGMSIVGQGAIRGGGIQSNQAAAATPTPVLLRRTGTAYAAAQAALTANSIITAVFNATNPAATTVRVGYTSTVNTGYATPTTGYRSCFRNTGETASSLAWGGTSASAFCAVALELDASVPQYDYVIRNHIDSDRITSRDAVMRKAVW